MLLVFLNVVIVGIIIAAVLTKLTGYGKFMDFVIGALLSSPFVVLAIIEKQQILFESI
jgi:uncharacterized membrane protein YgaE (UPF0421/DUF939 family)